MNKEEILSRNRKEAVGKPDERELKIYADASKIGMTVGGLLCVLIVLFSYYVKLPVLSLAAWSVYFAMSGSRCLYQFLKIGNRTQLFQTVIGLGFSIAGLIYMVVLGLKK